MNSIKPISRRKVPDLNLTFCVTTQSYTGGREKLSFLPRFSPFFNDWPTFITYNNPLKVIPEGVIVEYLPVGSYRAPKTIIGKNIFSGLKSLTPYLELMLQALPFPSQSKGSRKGQVLDPSLAEYKNAICNISMKYYSK